MAETAGAPTATQRGRDRAVDRGRQKRRAATRRDLPTLAAPRPGAAPAADGAARAAAAAPTTKPRRPAGPPPLAPLERRLKRDLARGRAAVDSVLDLHGMTQAEAHHALRGFLVQAQTQDFRLVIVITGKGARADRDDTRLVSRDRRAAPPRPALAARTRPALDRARLRGGRPRPRRRRRALRPPAPPRPALRRRRRARRLTSPARGARRRAARKGATSP